MLALLRQSKRSLIIKMIFSVSALSLLFFGLSFILAAKVKSGVVASVAGKDIYKRQVDQQVYGNQSTENNIEKVRRNVLDSIIQVYAVSSYLQDNNYDFPYLAALDWIKYNPRFQTNKLFDMQRFKDHLTRYGLTEDSLVEQIKQNMLLEDNQFTVQNTSMLLKEEQDQLDSINQQVRDISAIDIDLQKFIHEVHISSQDVIDYYRIHKLDFYTQEKVKFSYIHFSKHDLLNHMKPRNNDLKKFFKENIKNYTKSARYTISIIKIKKSSLKDKKTSFVSKQILQNQWLSYVQPLSNQLRRIISTDQYTWELVINEKEFLEENLPSILQNNIHDLRYNTFFELSLPSRNDFYVIKVNEYHQKFEPQFLQVKEEVYKNYVSSVMEKDLINIQEEISDLLFMYSTSLNPVSKKFKFKVKETSWYEKERPNLFLKNPNIISSLFSNLDVMHDSLNSGLLKLNSDEYIAFRVKELKKAKQLPFAKAKGEILRKLKKEHAVKLQQENANKIIAYLNSGHLAESTSKHFNFKWKRVQISMLDPDNDFHDFVFSLPAHFQNDKENFGVIHKDNSIKIVVLNRLYKNRKTNKTENFNYIKDLEYFNYVSAISKQYKAKIY
jgi:peptidyl-prolyl cis-trans isomerase D